MNRVGANFLRLTLPLLLQMPDCFGADFPAANSEYHQRVWTTEDGLPNNMVCRALQTRDGYLWIGTYTGLARFDGLKFTVFNHQNSPLPKTEVRMPLTEDAEGNLWIGTEHGLFRYKDGRFTGFMPRDGLWHEEIVDLHIGKSGKLWIGTGGGLNVFEDGSIQRLPTADWPGRTDKAILKVYEDGSGFLWVVTIWSVERLEIKTGKSEIVFLPSEGAPPRSVYIDPQGKYWFGSYGSLLQLREGQWIRYPQPNDGAGGPINTLRTDHDGSLWFTTGITGLGRLAQGKFSYFNSQSGLPDDWISGVYEDREANLWLGTIKAGLVRWQPRRILTLSREDGLPHDEVRAISEGRDGSVWIGTDGGLSRLQFPAGKPTFTNYSTNHGLPINTVRAVCEDRQGRVWVGTELGLDRLENGSFHAQDVPGERFEKAVRVIYEDRSGTIWFGSKYGLHRLPEGSRATFQMADGLSTNEARVLLESRDNALWVGTLGGGLNRLVFPPGTVAASRESAGASKQPLTPSFDQLNRDRKRDAVKFNSESTFAATSQHAETDLGEPRPRVTIYNTAQGLSNDFITALYEEDDGTLWVGTRHGLNRLKNGRLASLTTEHGLPDNWINSILDDGSGNLWMSSDKGIFHIKKADLNRCADGQTKSVPCIVYDENEGLLTRRTNGGKSQPAGCKTLDGRLWFATPKGVVIIDPKKALSSEVAPIVVIEQIRTNGKITFDNASVRVEPPIKAQSSSEMKANPQLTNLRSKINLPPGSAQVLEIHYTANTFVAPERARFRYRLHGFETNWVEASTRRVAYYTNLKAGDYRFDVTACDHRGLWNETGSSFAFYLAPHFYETGRFYILCAVALALSGYALYRWRLAELRTIQILEQQNRLAEERTRIARDIHDDLGANLTQIGLLAALADRSLLPGHQAAAHVRKMAAATSEIVQSVDEIVWSISPQNDTLRSLLAYLRKYAIEFLETAGIRARLEWPDQIPSANIPAVMRHHLFLVVKEALHNVVQHAAASDVALRVSVEASVLTLALKDDGCGFEVNEAGDVGNGLANMEKRITSLGGQFELTSQVGVGTQIVIKVPLATESSVPNK